MNKTHKYYHFKNSKKKHYSLRTINSYSIEQLTSIKENSCIVLSFSKRAFSYIKTIIIKCHIFFGIKNPEIYLHPISNIYAISLHSNCEICKYWITKFIEGNEITIEKISEILFTGKNPVLLELPSYLEQIISFSDIINSNIINKNIEKKYMPNFGNIYIDSRIIYFTKFSNNELIDIFKTMTKNSWNNLTDNNCVIARCCFYMNFSKEKDIVIVKDIFPSDIFDKIIKICSYIKYTNNNIFSKILNIYEQELFNIKDIINDEKYNSEDNKEKNINDKEKNIINLSDDDDSLIEEINVSSESIKKNELENFSIFNLDEGKLSQKKEKVDNSKMNVDMLKKKRKDNE